MIILAPPELEGGFLLAGVEVHQITDPAGGAALLDRLVEERTAGVVAVYEPFLSAMPVERRQRLERSLQPVVVPLPTGLVCQGGGSRRARLLARLQRAIGFQVTFGEEAK